MAEIKDSEEFDTVYLVDGHWMKHPTWGQLFRQFFHNYFSIIRRGFIMIPTAKLRALYTASNPPKLLGFDVIVDGKSIATLPPEEVLENAAIEAIEARRLSDRFSR